MLVEEGTDLDAAEEGEEGVDGKNPTYSALIQMRQLVGGQVGLESADRVPVGNCTFSKVWTRFRVMTTLSGGLTSCRRKRACRKRTQARRATPSCLLQGRHPHPRQTAHSRHRKRRKTEARSRRCALHPHSEGQCAASFHRAKSILSRPRSVQKDRIWASPELLGQWDR